MGIRFEQSGREERDSGVRPKQDEKMLMMKEEDMDLVQFTLRCWEDGYPVLVVKT